MRYETQLTANYIDKNEVFNTILEYYEKSYKLFRIFIDIWDISQSFGVYPESFDVKEWEEYLKKINSDRDHEIFISFSPLYKFLDRFKNFDWNKRIDYAMDGKEELIGKTYAEAAGDFYTEFLPKLEAEGSKYDNVNVSFILRIIVREGETTK